MSEIESRLMQYIDSGELKRLLVRAPRAFGNIESFNSGIIIDHIGPMPSTARGNKYILTCVDFFTGYLLAVPCKTVETKEVISILLHKWFMKFGVPKSCHHDRGSSFTSKLYQAYLQYFDIESRAGQPYSPTTQGKVESFNKKLKTVFQSILDTDNRNDWDKYIDIATFSLNSCKQNKTSFSAHKLAFGREFNQPTDLFMDHLTPKLPVHSHNIQAYKIHKKVRDITNKTRMTIARMNKCTKKTYDKHVNFSPFSEGDYCMILKHVTNHKYERKWLGPYRVTKCIAPYLYTITIPTGTKVVNIKIMKHFKPNKYTKLHDHQPITNHSTAETTQTSKPTHPDSCTKKKPKLTDQSPTSELESNEPPVTHIEYQIHEETLDSLPPPPPELLQPPVYNHIPESDDDHSNNVTLDHPQQEETEGPIDIVPRQITEHDNEDHDTPDNNSNTSNGDTDIIAPDNSVPLTRELTFRELHPRNPGIPTKYKDHYLY